MKHETKFHADPSNGGLNGGTLSVCPFIQMLMQGWMQMGH